MANQNIRIRLKAFDHRLIYNSAREIVELAMVVGFYVSTAIFVKALAVPAEKTEDSTLT